MTTLKDGFQGKVGYLLVSLGVLVADQWSKWWIEENVARGAPIKIIDGFLDLTLVHNTGVAFGLLPARGQLGGVIALTVLGLVALTVVTVYFWRTPTDEPLLLSALALILGGAVGNLADRIASGAVTDFIDVYYRSYHWHTFNVADSAITVGIGLMLLEILRSRGTPEAEAAAEEAAEEEG